jgi:hypothetical protein
VTIKNPCVVFVSDIHINSKQAVSLKKIDLGDGNYYEANKIQTALLAAWNDMWGDIKQRAGGKNLVIIFGGEIIDIDFKNRSNQYITKSSEQARDHALELLEKPLSMASKVIVVRGTEAHVGNNGEQDEKVAAMIDKERKGIVIKNGREFSWHYFRGYIGGRMFDVAHHVNMGGMARTERNAANHLAADLMMSYNRWGEAYPDFALRGHVHRFADSSFNYPIRAVISGCWQTATSYVHRISKGADKPEIGALFIDPSSKTVERLFYDYKRESPEFV